MKIVLAGAFGKLGSDILRALCATDHSIVAADAVTRVPADVDPTRFETRQIDVTRPETLKGLCDGVTGGPVKTVPAFMMDVLAHLPKIKRQGKSDVMKFSKFTLLNDCVGDTEIAGRSFRAYIAEKSYAPIIEAELAAKAAGEKGGECR